MYDKFQLTTKVLSGAGVISELPNEAKRYATKNIMVVTDKGLEQAGVIDKIRKPLDDANYNVVIFDDVQPNPDIKIAHKCAEEIKEKGIELVVAVGGGSSIDTAKSACMIATNGGNLLDYAGFERFKNDPVPLFAVPTTAGTGSEVTIVAVMSDEENDKKFTVGGQRLVPKVALLDPELTMSLPRRITAYTGLDALSHAIESYTSVNAQTITDSLNVTAIKMIFENLPKAVLRGDNIVARKNMLDASCIASMTCNSTYLGLIHAIASPICAYYPIAHGIACAVLLPEVMQYNLPVAVEKFANLALVLNLGKSDEPTRQLAQKTVDAVRQLCADCGMNMSLRELGIKEDKLEAMAEYAANYVQARTNCRKATVADVLEILKRIY